MNRVGGGLAPPTSHTTGHTVPYHGGSQTFLKLQLQDIVFPSSPQDWDAPHHTLEGSAPCSLVWHKLVDSFSASVVPVEIRVYCP